MSNPSLALEPTAPAVDRTARVDAPSLTWINHAAFLTQMADVRLVCDPWLHGSVFNRGFHHITPTRFGYEDFSDVTHIWFSHQHPDHFHPPDLRKIPAELRKRIRVLYHRTIDKKVIQFCKSLGFRDPLEMEERRWYELTPGYSVCCGIWYERDSWLAIRSSWGTILNLNDCIVDAERLARDIARSVGGARLLMSQYSYASWEPDRETRMRAAREHLERIAIQMRVFKPEFVVPFASFGFYSNADNFFMNDAMNHVSRAARFIEERGSHPVVLYPGERWELGSPHHWGTAAARYDADFDACVASGPVDQPYAVPLAVLTREASTLQALVRRKNPFAWLYPQGTTTVRLSDLGCTVVLGKDGLQMATDPNDFDIEIASDSLHNCLRTPWGSEALKAGRFQSGRDDRQRKFFHYFKLADWNNHGYVLAAHRFLVITSFVMRQFRRKLYRRFDALLHRPLAHQR